MRARLRESLLLEVGQTNGRIRAWFDDLPAYLGEGAPGRDSDRRPRAAELADWKAREPLVGIPFLLDAEGSILYPEAAKAGEPDDETRRFYWRYLNVFGNQEPIPVYRNIAEEYESSIVGRLPDETPNLEAEPAELADELTEFADESAEFATESAAAVEMPARADEAMNAAENPEIVAEPSSARSAPSAEKSAPAARSTPAPTRATTPVSKDERAVQSKVAQSIFESDVEVQRQVYDLAAGEGKETLKRNVNPRIDAANTRESAAPRSVIIESSRYFRDIVAGAERGIVPRIFDNSFVLIYWERRGTGLSDANSIWTRSGTPLPRAPGIPRTECGVSPSSIRRVCPSSPSPASIPRPGARPSFRAKSVNISPTGRRQ